MSLHDLSTLRVSLDKGVLYLKMHRPKQKNAMCAQSYKDLTVALDFAEHSDEVLCVVLTGTGKFFTAGADISASFTAGNSTSSSQPPQRNSFEGPTGIFMVKLMSFPKVVIAAVNGPAIGIGTTLLPHCDIVYSVSSAYFWTPFMRLALTPEFGSSILFERRFGTSVASELLLGSVKMSAERMKDCGLISRIFVDRESMDLAVAQLCKKMIAQPLALKSSTLYKRMMKPKGYVEEMRALIKSEFELLDARALNGEIPQAAMQFLESRKKARMKARM